MSQNKFTNVLAPYIQYVWDVFNRYGWAPDVRHELESDLYSLKRRMDDNCVNIAVVGEFSSGKSSVINAMLGIDLLVVDDLPDTTLVPSVISYSEKPFLEIINYKGENSRNANISIEKIRDCIAEYSFRESLMTEKNYDDAYIDEMTRLRDGIAQKASKIKRFNIGIPSDFLRQGFHIIDTPGLNSLNPNCIKVTNEVLSHADSAIIVGMATDGGLHQHFREKLAEAIGDRLEQSCVIFTHYDQMTPEKRKRNFTYLHAVTASYFNLTPDRLLVVPMVPPTILKNLEGKRFGNEHEEMLRMTCHSMGKVIAFSVRQREKIIVGSLQKILSRILSNLQKRIIELRNRYEIRLSELERSKTTPLESFISSQLESLTRSISAEAAANRMTVSRNLNGIIADTKKELEWSILRRKDLDDLQKYMQNGLQIKLKKVANEMNTQAVEGSAFIVDTVRKNLDAFEKALACEFQRLNIVNLPLKRIVTENEIKDVVLSDAMKDAIEFTDSEVGRENAGYAFAIVGAIIGSIFTFGIGTAIGAAIGSFLGVRGRSTSVEAVYKRMKPKYEKELDKALNLQKNKVLAAYDVSLRSHIDNFKAQLGSYNGRYKQEIDNLIEVEKQYKLRINESIRQIREDLDEINNHQNKIKYLWKIN